MSNFIFDKYKILKTIDDDSSTVYLVEECETNKKFILRKVLTDTESPLYDTAVKEFKEIGRQSLRIDKKANSPVIIDFLSDSVNNYLLLEYKDDVSLRRIIAYPSIGKILNNRYVVIRGIAAGGFGIVYIVRDLSLPSKYWALKEMQEEGGFSEIIERSFRIEAEMLSTLEHSAIPRISDFFVEKNRLYLVMDYVQGETLRKLLRNLKKKEHFTEERIVNWALSICDVLNYLHNLPSPVIFRDLKPDNIMITPEDDVRLIDFGIAKVFQGQKSETTKYALLTEGYAPQEQMLGKAEPRSDIYALGATLYHLLSGKHPRDMAPDFPSLQEISPFLSKIISKALQQKITDRYQSVEDMKRDLLVANSFMKAKKYLDRGREYAIKGDNLNSSTEYMQANMEYVNIIKLQGENYELLSAIAETCEKMGFKEKAREVYIRILTLDISNSLKSEIQNKINLLGDTSHSSLSKIDSSDREISLKTKTFSFRFFTKRKYILTGVIFILLVLAIIFILERFMIAERCGSRGAVLYRQGKYEEALMWYDRALKLDSISTTYWYGRGNSLRSLGRYDEAIKCYEKVLSLDPKFVDAWFDKGLALKELKKYEEALTCFNRVLNLDPLYVLAFYHKGDILYNQEKYEEAMKCFDETLKSEPHFIEAWYIKGLILVNEKNYEESIKCFDKALEVNPNHLSILQSKGEALVAWRKNKEAIKCFDKILALNSDNISALRNKGVALLGQEEYKEAAKYYEKILTLSPEDTNALADMGFILYEEEKYEEALIYLNKCLELAPDAPGVWYYKGNVLYEQGKYKEALECYDKSLDLDYDNSYVLSKRKDTMKILKNRREK
ncbi:MAG TPA: tetratricopeptide repeat protein [Candidatus Eremiobacteraeota bacterium]|nr:tetratricopeptide repeat protein [Candidatus Eremiobacteraeota bacterium]